MELEFDNEIDALLRKARDDRGVLVGDTLKLHLDADEIAAFAENAVPEASKKAYVAHFAECDGCRKTLSSVILLNSEAGVETASAVVAPAGVESALPWYRKLFLFPNLANLAYLMGSVVLLFSGFLVISVLRNSDGNSSSEVSQIRADEPAVSGPNLDYSDGSSNSNMSANAVNTAANTTATAANSVSNSPASPNPGFASNTSVMPADEKNQPRAVTDDRVVTGRDTPATAAAPQPPPPKEKPVEADNQTALLGREKRSVPSKDADKKAESKLMQEQAPAGAGGPFQMQKGPSRNEQRNDARMRENELASKKAGKADASTLSNRRQVAGKTFELRQGVWYESAYRGQTTTNIRRRTDDFRKLESGLRYIADSFSSTIVVVWRDKAYRID